MILVTVFSGTEKGGNVRKLCLLILTLVILVNLGFASGVRHSGARKPVFKTYKPARRHGR
jgi:hypothetical protein